MLFRSYVVGYGGNATTNEFRIALNVWGAGQLAVENWGAGWTSSASLQANTWYHVAVTYSGSGQPTFYVNGTIYGVASTWGSPAVGTTSTGGRISGRPDGSNPMNGLIDEVRIYNRALSASEIAGLYNPKVMPNYQDLRFVASDGLTVLPHWMEADGRFWVKMPTIGTSSQTIYEIGRAHV